MLVAEFADFEALLRKHSQVYSKKLTDEMVQGYWEALKDLALPTVRRCGDNHLRYSKFFPKPMELRPRDDNPKSVKEDHAFNASIAENIRNWGERIRTDPIGGRRLLLAAYAARTDIACVPGSEAHSERLDFIWAAARRIDAMEREQ